MRGHLLCDLKLSAIFQIRRNARRPKRVISNLGPDPSGRGDRRRRSGGFGRGQTFIVLGKRIGRICCILLWKLCGKVE